MGKGENAENQHFLLFPQCFLLYQREKIIIVATFNLSSASAFGLVTSKMLSFGKELPDNKTLGLPKLKAFTDNKSNFTQNIKVVFHRTENIVGEKKPWLPAFSSFPSMFSKSFYSSVSKVFIVW